MELSNMEILQYAVSNGMIDTESLQKSIEMKKKEEYLKKHQYAINKGKDGYWRTYLPDEGKGRRLVKKKSEEDLKEEVIKFYYQKEQNPTVTEVFYECEDRRLSLKKICKATYDRDERYFLRHYGELGKRRIKSISEDEWGDFLEEEIADKELTPKSFSGLKGITRTFLKRAKKRKLIDFNIVELFENLDVSDSDFKKVIKEDYEEVFDEYETDVMIKYLVNHLDTSNIAILLMFLTGVRIGEVVTLRHSDFSDNTFNVRRTETKYKDENGNNVVEVKEYPKTKAGIRTAIIPNDYIWICDKIKCINPFGYYIFTKNDIRITAQAVRQRQKRLCRKLKIYPKPPHKVRKTYGTILMDNNVDKRLVMDQMGHTDIMTSEIHYHRNRKTIEKKSSILSSIPDLQAR